MILFCNMEFACIVTCSEMMCSSRVRSLILTFQWRDGQARVNTDKQDRDDGHLDLKLELSFGHFVSPRPGPGGGGGGAEGPEGAEGAELGRKYNS